MSARVPHKVQEPVMGFIGRLEKHPRVRAKQGKEARKVFKRALDFSSHRSSNVLSKKRRPPETKEEIEYWLSKSEDKASEKQFFVRPVRPNRPFRTLPPRLVPAGALLYIVPAFLGDDIVFKTLSFFILQIACTVHCKL